MSVYVLLKLDFHAAWVFIDQRSHVRMWLSGVADNIDALILN